MSQKTIISHKINKKGYFKQKCQASEKYVHLYALNTLNDCISAAWRGGDQSVTLLRCNEAQVALITAFSSSALLGLLSHLPLDNDP